MNTEHQRPEQACGSFSTASTKSGKRRLKEMYGMVQFRTRRVNVDTLECQPSIGLSTILKRPKADIHCLKFKSWTWLTMISPRASFSRIGLNGTSGMSAERPAQSGARNRCVCACSQPGLPTCLGSENSCKARAAQVEASGL